MSHGTLGLNRFSRRGFVRAGVCGLAGLTVAGEPRLAGAALARSQEEWLTIKNIDRTTVKLPYREVPGRNMARELPHWAWSEICRVTLKSGSVGHGETLLYYTWGATSDEDVGRAQGRNAAELMWDDGLGAGLQIVSVLAQDQCRRHRRTVRRPDGVRRRLRCHPTLQGRHRRRLQDGQGLCHDSGVPGYLER